MSNTTIKQNNQQKWRFLPIKDFAHTTSGGTPKRGIAEYYNGNVPWVKSGDLNDNQLNSVDEFITQLGLEKSSAKLFKPGTVLIALYGATIGRLSILNFEAASNQAVCGITLPEDIDVKYVFYYLLSIRRKLIGQGKGGAQPNINQQIVKETIVPLAPPEQQKRIVAKIEELFSHIDAGIEALKKAKQLLKQYRQSILKAAVTGELTKEWREANKDKLEPASQLLERILKERRQKWEEQQLEKFKTKGKMPKNDKWKEKYKELILPNADELDDMPEEWGWANWEALLSNEVGSFKRGPFGSTLKKAIFVESGYKVYEQYCPINDDCSFERYYITAEKFKELESFAVKAGDFLISCSGVTLGRVTQVPIEYKEGVINQALLRVRINNVAGVAIPNVKGVKDLKAIPVPLPSISEQLIIYKKVHEKTSAIDRIELDIEEQLKKSERNKQSVLASAFTGKLECF